MRPARVDRLNVDEHPRVVDHAAATAFLGQWGQVLPVVVNRTGHVLWGVEWVLAARDLGWQALDVHVVDLPPAEATAFTLGVYRAVDRGSFMPHDVFAALNELDAAPDLKAATGYTDAEHKDLRLKLVPPPVAALVDELAPPELGLGWQAPTGLPVRHRLTQPVAQATPTFDDDPVRFKTLISFHYFKKHDVAALRARLGGAQMFADSGAYSAKSQGAEIVPAEYIAWLTRWHPHLEAFATLDVIGDAAASAANVRMLEEAGVDALPVFHGGEDFGYLEAYCEQYPYVCLGGMVGGASGLTLHRWVAKCFDVAARYGAVFHGFGQTSLDVLADFPWYSVDSSSWGSGHRFGRVDLWDDQACGFVDIGIGDHAGVYRHAELVRAHGVDPELLADRGQYHHRYAVQAASAAWRRYAAHLRRRHGPVEVRDGSRLPGLHLYLVDGSDTNLQLAALHAGAQPAAPPPREQPVRSRVAPAPVMHGPPSPHDQMAAKIVDLFDATLIQETA